jgi:hypothetical protein
MEDKLLDFIRIYYLRVNEGSNYNDFLVFLDTIKLSWQNDYTLEQLKELFPDNSTIIFEEEDFEGDQ